MQAASDPIHNPWQRASLLPVSLTKPVLTDTRPRTCKCRALTGNMCGTTLEQSGAWAVLKLLQKQAYPKCSGSSCSGSASLAGSSGAAYLIQALRCMRLSLLEQGIATRQPITVLLHSTAGRLAAWHRKRMEPAVKEADSQVVRLSDFHTHTMR